MVTRFIPQHEQGPAHSVQKIDVSSFLFLTLDNHVHLLSVGVPQFLFYFLPVEEH